MTDPIMVKPKHIRDAKMCSRGARKWFERYDLNFTVFVTTGYPVEVIEGTGDDLGRLVASYARKDAEGESP